MFRLGLFVQFTKANKFIHTFSKAYVFEIYNIENKKKAKVKDGHKYEDNLEKYLKKKYSHDIKNEKEISFLLNNFNKEIDITKLRGIDLIINNHEKKQIYVIQVKIGAKTRDIEHCKKFINTLHIFRNYVKHSSNYKVIPIWYSSAELEVNAKKELKKEGVNIVINSNWNINLNKCCLLKDFIYCIDELD
jgi:hypothetical protein